MGINEVVQIGNRIKEYRKSKGFTQKELALRANIPYSTYSNYENNNREPNREQLQKIATALNVPLYELMGFDGSIRVNGNKQRPFDIALQKFRNNEELTYEDEQAIIEYVESNQIAQEKEDIKRISQKAYGEIYYRHSHSYASSAEELDKLQEERQIEFEEKRTKPFTASLSQTHNKENDIYIDPNLQKLYDSYEDSYSFDNLGEKKLLKDYRMLNEIGQLEARKRVEELTEIPRYTKADKPPQE